jgi:hypothetical protein
MKLISDIYVNIIFIYMCVCMSLSGFIYLNKSLLSVETIFNDDLVPNDIFWCLISDLSE